MRPDEQRASSCHSLFSVLCSLFSVLVLAAACSGKKKQQDQDPPPAPALADAAPPAAGEVAWLVALPAIPGVPVLQGTGGPLVHGGAVVVASSAIGFVGVDAASGEVLWQRPGEERPFDPVAVGDAVALPGRCAHKPRPRPGLVACVDRVAPRTGARVGGDWVRAPDGVGRAEPIGVRGEDIVWAGDGAVWIDGGGELEVLARRDPDAVALSASAAGVVWRDRVVRAGGAELRFEEEAVRGVAGPVDLGGRVAAVRDDRLAWWGGDGAPLPAPDVRLSFAPGTLGAAGDHLRAVGLEGGLHVVTIDPATAAIRRGPAVAGLQAHCAVAGPDHALIVASRRDQTLTRDDVTWFDASGAPRWTWAVPVPADGRRLDPIGVAATGEAVFVFWDGRQLARLRP